VAAERGVACSHLWMRNNYTVKAHSISSYNDILRALDAIGKIISVLADFTDNVILVLRVNLFTPF
jgi:hypothetical protein